ncbi:helix-turn-helix domain-containing protein [Neobacillus mesonae]|uniref:Transcriptional regulator n=1 Tax=Neobacillus mesonae TaxID=1193713 RepID=A0A3Q9QXY9_9BACI|nr:helix-turn-helix domain-containing protein [Neobacillus mesonae]AZU63051.1 transcriptional regulator [Neobacillus mesonae]
MIGKRIKILREKMGLSITELASRADVSKSYISQIERGAQSNPSLQFLRKIAVPLETNIEFFLEDSESNESLEIQLDDEWKALIQAAINNGLQKEDFRRFLSYIKFQSWLEKQENQKTNK